MAEHTPGVNSSMSPLLAALHHGELHGMAAHAKDTQSHGIDAPPCDDWQRKSTAVSFAILEFELYSHEATRPGTKLVKDLDSLARDLDSIVRRHVPHIEQAACEEQQIL